MPTVAPVQHASWRRLGQFDATSFLTGVVGFAGGYVIGQADGAGYWFSPDGVEWTAGDLAGTVDDCLGEESAGGYGTSIVSDGQAVMVLGKTLAFDDQNCAGEDGVGSGVVSWLTTDGETWAVSEQFGHRHALADDAWRVPDGWEVLTASWDAPSRVWHSVDGRTWEQRATLEETYTGDADATGARLVERGTRLHTSTDGATWRQLGRQPNNASYLTEILAPGPGGEWILVYETDTGSAIWTSPDLRGWRERSFPEDRVITQIAATRAGFVASAERADRYHVICNQPGCPPAAERQYISPDGTAWYEIEGRLRDGAFFADGPAGVIAVGRYDGTVWLLGR